MFGGKKKPQANIQTVWSAALSDHVIGVSWSRGGAQVAAAAVSGPVVIFEAATGLRLFELAGHGFGTAAIAFHPTDPVLATVGQDGKVRLWDTILGQERAAFEGGEKWVEKLAWSPDGKLLATAAGRKVRVWELATGEMRREFTDHKSTISDLAWQPGTSVLAVAMYNGVVLYDLQHDDQPPRHFSMNTLPLKLAWSPNGKLLAHGNQDSTIHFWYADSGKDLLMSGYPRKVRELSWDFASRKLATGGGEIVCIWDCSGKGPENSKPDMLQGHQQPISVLAYQRRGFLLASGGMDGRVCLWQTANRQPLIAGLTLENAGVTDLAWSQDDRRLLASSSTGGVAMFRIA